MIGSVEFAPGETDVDTELEATMHQSTQDLALKIEAPGTQVRAVEDWNGISIGYVQLPAGTDLGPMLQGLPDDACPVEHWGYVVAGQITVKSTEGETEELKAGDVYFLPPGHTAVTTDGVTFIEFTPHAKFKAVLSHLMQKAGASAG